MRKVNLFYTFLFASFLFFNSCVDNSYDLSKNVDLTIQVGGDLSIPGCNTEELTLKKIFDIDESNPDNAIKADEQGWYSLSKSGDGAVSEVKVQPVKIRNSGIEEIISELEFKKAELEAIGRAEYEIEQDRTNFTLSDDRVTKDLIKVDYALPDVPVPLEAHIFFDPLNNRVSVLHLKEGFAVYIPKFLRCKLDEEKLGDKASDFVFVELDDQVTDERDLLYKDHFNKLMFLKDQKIMADRSLLIPLLIDGMLFEHILPEQGLQIVKDAEYNKFMVDDDMILAGTSYILSSDQVLIDDLLRLNLHTNLVMGSEQNEVKFLVTEAKAIVDPKIDVTIDPVELNGLPDFLEDEAVVMDLENPMITLNIKNTSPVDVNLYADLIAMKNGEKTVKVGIGKGPETDGVAHNTDPILIKSKSVTKVCLSRKGEGAPEGVENIKVADLGRLISKIPDRISIENVVAKVLQQEYILRLGTVYEVETAYNVNAPLAFGKDLSIIYNDTIDGWNEDITDLDLEVKELNVKMEALNKIPLKMEVCVIPIDEDGNAIDEISVEQPEPIAPGNGLLGHEAGVTVSQMSIKLRTEKKGVMRRLDGLQFRINATNNEYVEYQGLQLNKNQTLKLNKVRLEVPGGIEMNLN